jgi:hypothetical protein
MFERNNKNIKCCVFLLLATLSHFLLFSSSFSFSITFSSALSFTLYFSLSFALSLSFSLVLFLPLRQSLYLYICNLSPPQSLYSSQSSIFLSFLSSLFLPLFTVFITFSAAKSLSLPLFFSLYLKGTHHQVEFELNCVDKMCQCMNKKKILRDR